MTSRVEKKSSRLLQKAKGFFAEPPSTSFKDVAKTVAESIENPKVEERSKHADKLLAMVNMQKKTKSAAARREMMRQKTVSKLGASLTAAMASKELLIRSTKSGQISLTKSKTVDPPPDLRRKLNAAMGLMKTKAQANFERQQERKARRRLAAPGSAAHQMKWLLQQLEGEDESEDSAHGSSEDSAEDHDEDDDPSAYPRSTMPTASGAGDGESEDAPLAAKPVKPGQEPPRAKTFEEIILLNPWMRGNEEIAVMHRRLRDVRALQLLPDSVVNHLCSTMMLEDVPPNTTLYTVGDPGQCMYIVVTGCVGLFRKSEDDILPTNSTFLTQQQHHQAPPTAIASEDGAETLATPVTESVRRAVARVNVVTKIGAFSDHATAPPPSLFSPGSAASAPPSVDAASLPGLSIISRCVEGESFGSLGMTQEDHRRPVTAVTVSRSRVLVLDRHHYLEALSASCGVSHTFGASNWQRILREPPASRTQDEIDGLSKILAATSEFAALAEDIRRHLSSLLTYQKFQPYELVYKEAETSDFFYIVVSGSVSLHRPEHPKVPHRPISWKRERAVRSHKAILTFIEHSRQRARRRLDTGKSLRTRRPSSAAKSGYTSAAKWGKADLVFTLQNIRQLARRKQLNMTGAAASYTARRFQPGRWGLCGYYAPHPRHILDEDVSLCRGGSARQCFGSCAQLCLPGHSFGDLFRPSFSYRKETAIAREVTEVVTVRKQQCRFVLLLLQSHTVLARVQFLRKLPLMRQMDDELVIRLSYALHSQNYKRGNLIVSQDMSMRAIYFIASGMVTVSQVVTVTETDSVFSHKVEGRVRCDHCDSTGVTVCPLCQSNGAVQWVTDGLWDSAVCRYCLAEPILCVKCQGGTRTTQHSAVVLEKEQVFQLATLDSSSFFGNDTQGKALGYSVHAADDCTIYQLELALLPKAWEEVFLRLIRGLGKLKASFSARRTMNIVDAKNPSAPRTKQEKKRTEVWKVPVPPQPPPSFRPSSIPDLATSTVVRTDEFASSMVSRSARQHCAMTGVKHHPRPTNRRAEHQVRWQFVSPSTATSDVRLTLSSNGSILPLGMPRSPRKKPGPSTAGLASVPGNAAAVLSSDADVNTIRKKVARVMFADNTCVIDDQELTNEPIQLATVPETADEQPTLSVVTWPPPDSHAVVASHDPYVRPGPLVAQYPRSNSTRVTPTSRPLQQRSASTAVAIMGQRAALAAQDGDAASPPVPEPPPTQPQEPLSRSTSTPRERFFRKEGRGATAHSGRAGDRPTSTTTTTPTPPVFSVPCEDPTQSLAATFKSLFTNERPGTTSPPPTNFLTPREVLLRASGAAQNGSQTDRTPRTSISCAGGFYGLPRPLYGSQHTKRPHTAGTSGQLSIREAFERNSGKDSAFISAWM